MRVAPTAFVAVVLTILSPAAHADQVVPSDRVTNGVTIRAEPTTNSASLGVLQPGQSPFVSSGRQSAGTGARR